MINFGNYNILKTRITACDYAYIVSRIAHSIAKGKKVVVAPLATDGIVLSYFDKKLQQILNSFHYTVPDSQYVRLALFLLYNVRLKDRVYGPKLFRLLCSRAAEKDWAVHIIGNDVQRLATVLQKQYRATSFSYTELAQQPITDSTFLKCNRNIKKTNPHIVIVGIGVPHQYTIASHITALTPIVCLGAALDFVSGRAKQSPEWIGKMGFEWLYRLAHEPKRLWKRYLVRGPLFVGLITIQYIARITGREID